ncbi:MAG: hypothetical protein OXI87_17515 [Albidovulum sp.]|nr:hypothetical protein [Albidovulum sp.]
MTGKKAILITRPIALLAIIVSACTDLSAVRDWSATSLQAVQFNEIVSTYANTPKRLESYDKDGANEWTLQSAERKAQADALQLHLFVVAEYMAALAALSDDKAIDYTQDVGSLITSLKKTGHVSGQTLDAAEGLAANIGNAVAGGWQKQKIGELIEKSDAPLQALLADLKSIVDKDFRRDLEIERRVLDLYFKELLDDSSASLVAKSALDEWYVLRMEQNTGRLAAVESYAAILDRIAEGHDELFRNRNDLGAATLANDLNELTKEIRKIAKQLIKP